MEVTFVYSIQAIKSAVDLSVNRCVLVPENSDHSTVSGQNGHEAGRGRGRGTIIWESGSGGRVYLRVGAIGEELVDIVPIDVCITSWCVDGDSCRVQSKQEQKAGVCALSADGCILWCPVKVNVPLVEYSSKAIKAALKKIDSDFTVVNSRLLWCQSSACILEKQGQVAMVTMSGKGEVEVVWVHQLATTGSCLIGVVTAGTDSTIYAVDASNILSLWSLPKCHQIATVDLKPLLHQLEPDSDECITHCVMLLDLSFALIYLSSSNRLLLVDLMCYCEQMKYNSLFIDGGISRTRTSDNQNNTLWPDSVWGNTIFSANSNLSRKHSSYIDGSMSQGRGRRLVSGFDSQTTPDTEAEGLELSSDIAIHQVAAPYSWAQVASLGEGWQGVRGMRGGGKEFYVWGLDKKGCESPLCVVFPSQHVCHCLKLPHPCVSMETIDPGPAVFIGEQALYGVAVGIRQEQLVNKLMVYSGAAMADSVCRSNHWDTLRVPLHTLKVGLQHKQLDTVAFFLKSREQLFTVDEAPELSTHAALSLTQILPALAQLKDTIVMTLPTQNLRYFSLQLLSLTLSHLHKVMANVAGQMHTLQASSTSTQYVEFETCSLEILRQLSVALEEFRALIPDNDYALPSSLCSMGASSPPVDSQAGGVVFNRENLSNTQIDMVTQWDKLDEKGVLVEGVVQGYVALAQSYCTARFGPASARYSHVEGVALEEVTALLHDCDMTAATHILANLGHDVGLTLRDMCMYTPHRSLRNYLASHLVGSGQLSASEQEMLHFTQHMETLYSCPSLGVARVLRTEGQTLTWEERYSLHDQLGSSKAPIMQHVQEVGPCDVDNSETASYSHTVLEWTRHWTDAHRSRILLDWAMPRGDTSVGVLVPGPIIWQYLCDHHDVSRLTAWITAQFDPHPGPNSKTPSWPYHHLITPEMVEGLQRCTTFTRYRLLDQLARYGVFYGSEGSDPSRMLALISPLGQALQGYELVTMQPHTHSLTPVHVHRELVQRFIKNNHMELLYFYLDHCGLTDVDEFVHDIDSAPPAWLDMLLAFRHAVTNNFDNASMHHASLVSHHALSAGGCDGVRDMLQQKYVGRALATLMYSTEDITQVLSDTSGQVALESFPTLKHALTHSQDDLTLQTTVYHLLKKDAPFDVTRLFGWQVTNTFNTTGRELPHCSLESLCQQQPQLQHHLPPSYYLRRARPCAAFTAFLQQLCTDTSNQNTLALKSVQDMAWHALHLALHHIADRPITAACCALTEMVGIDSTHLRLHLQVANQIVAHQVSMVTGSMEAKMQKEASIQKEIGGLMGQCVDGSTLALAEIYNLLEDSCRWKTDKLDRTSAGQVWLLAQMFSMCHGLRPCLVHLQTCAAVGDWLTFLTYAQMYQYTPRQLLPVIKEFPSYSLRQHLTCVIEDMIEQREGIATASKQPREANKISATTDARGHLYLKMGLQPRQSSDVVESSDQDTPATDDSPICTTHDGNGGTVDVLDLILDCDKLVCPWRALCAESVRIENPTLSVIATCYKDHDLLTCLCTWMLTSVGGDLDLTYDLTQKLASGDLCSEEDVLTVVGFLLDADAMTTLYQALRLFIPESAVVSLVQCVRALQSAPSTSTQHIASCRNKLAQTFPSKHIPSRLWGERAIILVVRHSLLHGDRPHAQGQLLKLVDEASLTQLFSCRTGVPDISMLHRLYKITAQTSIQLNMVNLLQSPSAPQFVSECHRVLAQLQDCQDFHAARLFAAVVDISCDNIILAQLQSEQSKLSASALWQKAETRADFWRRCQEVMSRHQMRPAQAAAFFQTEAEKCDSPSERGYLLHLSHGWLARNTTSDRSEIDKLFMEIWTCKIQVYVQYKELGGRQEDPFSPDSLSKLDKKQLLVSQSLPQSTRTTTTSSATLAVSQEQILSQQSKRMDRSDQQHNIPSLTPSEEAALNTALCEMANSGRLSEALYVARTFQHHCPDLDVAVAALGVALGETDPGNLDGDIRRLLVSPQNVSPRLRRVSTSLVAFPRTGSVLSVSSEGVGGGGGSGVGVREESEERDTVLEILQSLVEHCTLTRSLVTFILTAYRISQMLRQSMQWVLREEDFSLLHALLAAPHSQRHLLAKAYITASGLQDAQVAGFLSDAILDALQFYLGIVTKLTGGFVGVEQPILPGAGVVGELQQTRAATTACVQGLIQLCDDPAVLGQRLLGAATAMASSTVETSHSGLTIEVELLTYSHDCFTLACHMEGISGVLRAARIITGRLEQAHEHTLMVSLLTGVGRFSEMTYIFDILNTHQQFELLFKKGMDKEDKLRLALLDYLKRYHPHDTDTFTMVAVHFSMYREIADNLKEDADRLLSKITSGTIDNNADTQSKLKSLLNCYSNAATNYSKVDCLRSALWCVQQCRLVALQTSLLPARACVIGLQPPAVLAFAESHAKFYETLLVVEAYGLQSVWPLVLYQKVVKEGQLKYLHDFRAHLTLSPALLTDISHRFQAETRPGRQMTANMRQLLLECAPPRLAHSLAVDLGLTDLVHDLLKGDGAHYLRDTCPSLKSRIS